MDRMCVLCVHYYGISNKPTYIPDKAVCAAAPLLPVQLDNPDPVLIRCSTHGEKCCFRPKMWKDNASLDYHSPKLNIVQFPLM